MKSKLTQSKLKFEIWIFISVGRHINIKSCHKKSVPIKFVIICDPSHFFYSSWPFLLILSCTRFEESIWKDQIARLTRLTDKRLIQYKNTRVPWTAMPALNKTNQDKYHSTFLRRKNIQKWCNYTRKKMFTHSFSFLA